MRFHYTAAKPDGRVEEGNLEAKGIPEALAHLAGEGLRPVSIKPIAGVEGSRHSFGQTITITDKVFLSKYLALMLKIGTDLFKALDILIADFEKPILKEFLMEIRAALEKGQPFYATFARYPQYFDPVFVNMVKAGEASGTLEKIFDDLAVKLEKEKELTAKVRGALIYPILLLSLSVLILIFLVTFALPKIAAVFQGGGFDPPLFSRIVFAVGLSLGRHALLIFGSLGVLVASGIYFFSFNRTGKGMFTQLLDSAPIIRKVVAKIALQRFASTLSSLLKAGLPILDALEITANAVNKPDVKGALLRISREGVSKGKTLGEAFRKESVFPATVSNLVAVSEKAGHLDEILVTLAQFYESEIDASVKNLVAFVEPVMLLGIGGIVGLIALSIIMPIYQLVGQF